MNNYHQQQVTMIENLPDVDEIENNDFTEQKLQKFIRKPQVLSPDSGMVSNNFHQQSYEQQIPQFRQPVMNSNIPRNNIQPYPQQMNCLDISHHIQESPICSKFYNNDKSVYIIMIVILAILCLLLIKKVMNL